VRCWLKTDRLKASSAAPLRAKKADYHNATTPPVAAIVEEITTLLRGTTLGSRLFPGTAVSGLPQGALGWLCAETDSHVMEDTVDLVLSQDNEEYREEEELIQYATSSKHGHRTSLHSKTVTIQHRLHSLGHGRTAVKTPRPTSMGCSSVKQ